MTERGAIMSHSDVEIDLPYLNQEKTRHGRWVLYVRKNGRRIRLKSAPGTPAFIAEYKAAIEKLGKPKPPANPRDKRHFANSSLGWLINTYLAESPQFAAMKPAGRRRRRAVLEALQESSGTLPAAMPPDRIAAGLAKRAALPGQANEWLKSVKALYSWARGVRLVETNPAEGIGKIKVATDGHHIWSIEEIAAFAKKHPFGTPAYLAMITLLFTGLRRDDATKLGLQHIRDGAVRFRASKTGSELLTAVAWPLAEAIKTRPQCEAMAVIVSVHGRAYASGNAFGNRMKDWTRQADIPHCTAHGLRKAGASIAAQEGASDLMLDAMFGWSTNGDNNQSRTYTRAASKLALASAGFELIAGALLAKGVIKRQAQPKAGTNIVAP